ncbi:MAG: DUF1540 domain-containing protein [Oscillospiraceae bacterium]
MNDTKRYNGKTGGIGCDAENCAYNTSGCSCTAEHIKVNGKCAQCTGETCCATFKPKGC